MAYYDITLIYAGGLMDERQFDESDIDEMMSYINAMKKEYFYNMEPTEIFGVSHPHEPFEDECSCVQYLSDHKPMWRNVRSRREVHEQYADWELELEANFLGLTGKEFKSVD